MKSIYRQSLIMKRYKTPTNIHAELVLAIIGHMLPLKYLKLRWSEIT